MGIRKTVAAIAIVVAATNAASSELSTKAAGGSTRTTQTTKTRAPHVIPESGVLDANDLIAIARLASTASTDQFSDDPSLKYIGRNFSFTPDADELSTDYDKDTHTLTVATPSYLDAFILDRQISETHYIGQNSFGASTTVSKTRGDAYGIENPGNTYSRKPISFEATLDGANARALSKALRLRLYGTLKKASGVYASNNSLVSEQPIITEPTVSEPTDFWIKQYLIAVDFTKAEWIDTRTGTVVKTEDLSTK